MRIVMDIAGNIGNTVGLRKDGSVAVQYDTEEPIWFSASEFDKLFVEVA